MRDPLEPKLSKWPFFFGDVLLLGAAGFISFQSKHPAELWQMVLMSGCVAAGAVMGILPFILEYRTVAKLAEAGKLRTAVEEIQNLEKIAAQISQATSQWQNIQGEAEKVGTAAKGLAERMGAEVKAFTEFMQKVNDTEKVTLRLEVDKMHRAESEWLQVSVRMLDHVYALNLGAARSGQANLIAQMTNFQNACREVVRRVGLTPFAANPAEPFDAERHQLLEGEQVPAAGGTVVETLATGYTFQGRLLRPALVRLGEKNGDAAQGAEPNGNEKEQRQLPLDTEAAPGK